MLCQCKIKIKACFRFKTIIPISLVDCWLTQFSFHLYETEQRTFLSPCCINWMAPLQTELACLGFEPHLYNIISYTNYEYDVITKRKSSISLIPLYQIGLISSTLPIQTFLFSNQNISWDFHFCLYFSRQIKSFILKWGQFEET